MTGHPFVLFFTVCGADGVCFPPLSPVSSTCRSWAVIRWLPDHSLGQGEAPPEQLCVIWPEHDRTQFACYLRADPRRQQGVSSSPCVLMRRTWLLARMSPTGAPDLLGVEPGPLRRKYRPIFLRAAAFTLFRRQGVFCYSAQANGSTWCSHINQSISIFNSRPGLSLMSTLYRNRAAANPLGKPSIGRHCWALPSPWPY